MILDSIMSEKSRVRYSFWDALADIGGFHDGLVLLITIVIGPYAAYGFFVELVSKLRKEPTQSKQHKRTRDA